MAKQPRIGITLGLDGEKEFKQKLSEINAGLKVNASQMQLVAATYQDGGKSVKDLTATHEALESQIVSQTKKVELLEKALANSIEKNGASSKKTMEWQASLNKAQAELANMNTALEENEKAMEDAQKSVKGLAEVHEKLESTIANQTEKMEALKNAVAKSIEKYGESSEQTSKWKEMLSEAEAELANMNTALAENEKAMEDATKKTVSLADVINGLADVTGIKVPPAMKGMVDKLEGISATGAAVVGVVGGIVAGLSGLSINAAKAADDLATLSSTTGLSTDALQEFEYASNLIDVSTDTMTGSITKMISTMRSARDGSEDISHAYSKLHVRIKDSSGQLRDANTVFYEVVDALGKVKNETERDALSMQIFGKSARDLNPLIEAGSGKLRELAKEAHDVGYVMDEETISSFVDLSDSMERVSKMGDTVKNKLAEAMLPVLTTLFDALVENEDAIKKIIDFGAKLAETILPPIIELLGHVAEILSKIVDWIEKLLEKVGRAGSSVMDFLGFGSGGADGRLTQTLAALSNNNQPVPMLTTTSIPRYARGTNFHPGGLATINEASGGGETIYLPRGTRVTPATQGDVHNYYITIDAKNVQEFNDIVRIAQNQRRSIRMGYVKASLGRC